MKWLIYALAVLLSSASFAQQTNIAHPLAPCVAFGSTTGTCLQGGGALGSPSSAGTIPAFTLGGTVAGGGNQINDVIIGTSTPLAGYFTQVCAGACNVGMNSGDLSVARTSTTGAIYFGNSSVYIYWDNTNFNFIGGPPKVTLANAATTSAVCYNIGTGLLSYDGTLGTCTTSTLRSKDLISQLSPKEGFEIVMKMEPWRYTLKKGLPTYQPGEEIGMVADYAEKVEPRLVAMNPDGSTGGFRYEQYTAALTAAIKYQQECFDSWKCRIFGIR